MAQYPHFEDIEVSCRCIRELGQMFVDVNLAYREYHDKYEITIWGQPFLEGEIEAENQPRPRSGRSY